MSLEPLMSSLPKELAPILSKIAGKAVVVTASASNNIAKDNAVQVCGPVAGSIQYLFNLSLHYHAGDIDACWRLIGGTNAVEVSTSKRCPLSWTAQECIQSSREESRLDNQYLVAQAPFKQQVQLHRQGKEPMPVLATFDPNTEGNWIASRIVKRLEFEYQQASIHKDVPTFNGHRFERTRIYVDVTCGEEKKSYRCQHRFYVVNHCKAYDILLGGKLCLRQVSNEAS